MQPIWTTIHSNSTNGWTDHTSLAIMGTSTFPNQFAMLLPKFNAAAVDGKWNDSRNDSLFHFISALRPFSLAPDSKSSPSNPSPNVNKNTCLTHLPDKATVVCTESISQDCVSNQVYNRLHYHHWPTRVKLLLEWMSFNLKCSHQPTAFRDMIIFLNVLGLYSLYTNHMTYLLLFSNSFYKPAMYGYSHSLWWTPIFWGTRFKHK